MHNSHIQAERYLIADDRFIFMFKDGAQAWEAKEFLVEQKGFEQITIENKPYYGKHAVNRPKDELWTLRWSHWNDNHLVVVVDFIERQNGTIDVIIWGF